MSDNSTARFQFSLRHLLVAVSLTAFVLWLALSYFHVVRESARARAQLEISESKHKSEIFRLELKHLSELRRVETERDIWRLRGGFADDRDPNRVTIGVHTDYHEMDKWRINIHLPANRRLVLCCALEGISSDGLPEPALRFAVEPQFTDAPGNLWVSVRILRQPILPTGKFHCSVVFFGNVKANAGIEIPPGHPLESWEFKEGTLTHFPVVQKSDPDVPCVIMRHKVDPNSKQGLLLWIEEESTVVNTTGE